MAIADAVIAPVLTLFGGGLHDAVLHGAPGHDDQAPGTAWAISTRLPPGSRR